MRRGHSQLWRVVNLCRAGVAVLAVALALGFSSPGLAHAWSMSKATNGFILTRSTDDTRTMSSVTHYYDYKGGSVPTSTYKVDDPSSYNASVVYSNVFATSGTMSYELPAVPGYKMQMIRTLDGVQDERHIFLYEPLNVAVSNPTTVVAVSALPTVSIGSSLSVAGTLPVDPWSTAGLPDQWQVFCVVLLVLFAGGVGGWWLMRSR